MWHSIEETSFFNGIEDIWGSIALISWNRADRMKLSALGFIFRYQKSTLQCTLYSVSRRWDPFLVFVIWVLGCIFVISGGIFAKMCRGRGGGGFEKTVRVCGGLRREFSKGSPYSQNNVKNGEFYDIFRKDLYSTVWPNPALRSRLSVTAGLGRQCYKILYDTCDLRITLHGVIRTFATLGP